MAQGFNFVYNLHGGKPRVETFVMKTTETLHKGDLLNLESGEVDLAVTTNTALLGLFEGPDRPADGLVDNPGVVSGTAGTTRVRVLTSPDAVYEDKDDTNARNAGVTLDISGATGAQALAASSNTEFVVIGRKEQSADPTRFKILDSLHPYILG